MGDILWYIGLLAAFVLLGIYWKDYIEISSLLKNLEMVFPKIALIIITLFIFKIFIKLSVPVLKKAVSYRSKSDEWKVTNKIYVNFIWFLALLVILSGVFGDLSSLGISLSLIGAGIALALQQAILSFAAWFLIVIKHPYKIGDRIYLPEKDILGDVEDITMLFTVLKEVAANDTITGKNIIIPNSTVFLEPITNYSYDVPHIWISLPFSVTYESDLTLAEKIIFDVADEVAGEEMMQAASYIRRKTPDSVQVESATEKPVIRVEFADSCITVRVRIMCYPKQIPLLRTEIYRKVHQEFYKPDNKDKVEIAYPHMELVYDNKKKMG